MRDHHEPTVADAYADATIKMRMLMQTQPLKLSRSGESNFTNFPNFPKEGSGDFSINM